MKNDLYSRLYLDAHLCKPECGDLGQINPETGKPFTLEEIKKILSLK